jgi:MFS family permease
MPTEPATLARDARIIGALGAGHFASHFYQLTLPPLFPVLRAELGVPWLALGALLSVFYVGSGVGQPTSGFLVDRLGARPVLLAGLGLLAGGIALVGLATAYWMLVPLALLAGLGNAVFHPADYAILNTAVAPRRLGRAYSVHGILGNLGWAAAPAVVVTLAGLLGWRAALVIVGGAGLALMALIASQGTLLAARREPPAPGPRGLAADVRVVLSPPIVAAFGYFTLSATATVGVKSFGVAAMVAAWGIPLGVATGALTLYLLATAAGILAGGLVADRARRHDAVAAGGLATGALLLFSLAVLPVSQAVLVPALTLAGFFHGVTAPSRDLLVRSATPPGASGKVFGFAYSGIDLGSALAPAVFGWLIDRGEPRGIFGVAAAVLAGAIFAIVLVRQRTSPAIARA